MGWGILIRMPNNQEVPWDCQKMKQNYSERGLPSGSLNLVKIPNPDNETIELYSFDPDGRRGTFQTIKNPALRVTL